MQRCKAIYVLEGWEMDGWLNWEQKGYGKVGGISSS